MQGKDKPLSMIRCGVADKVYGVAMDHIRSIEQTEQVTWETNGSGFDGVLQTAHETIPVLNLGNRLGKMLTGAAEDQRLIVLEGKRPFALLVDEVSPTLHISPTQIMEMPTAVLANSNDFFEGLVRLEEQFIPLLAPVQLHPQATPRPQTAPTRPTLNGSLASETPDYQPQLVVFTVPNMPTTFSFALSLSQVPEISDLPPITPIPQAPNLVLGLTNWHAQPVPVLDLGRYWQQPITDFEDLRLLIVRTAVKDLHLGLPVNPNVRLLRLPLPYSPAQDKPDFDPALIRGRIEFEGEQLIIPDMVKLLHVIKKEG
ncbi:MAG: chemotaxis protein CheW [Chloroflexota bacterium]